MWYGYETIVNIIFSWPHLNEALVMCDNKSWYNVSATPCEGDLICTVFQWYRNSFINWFLNLNRFEILKVIIQCNYVIRRMIINNQSRQILQMFNMSKAEFLRNIKIFVNYVSKYYNGTPSVRNRLISYTQLDMTCPRRVERDIPHLQWHNFLRLKQMCILRNINDTVTMWCLVLFITLQWLWIKLE